MTGAHRRLLVWSAAALGATCTLLLPSSPGVMPWVWAGILGEYLLGSRRKALGYLGKTVVWIALMAAILSYGIYLLDMTPRPGNVLVAAFLQVSLLLPIFELSDRLRALIQARLPPARARILSGAVQLLLLVVSLPGVFLSINAHRAAGTKTPPPYLFGERREQLTFEGAGGTELSAVYIPHPSPRGAVLLSHGLGAEKWQFLPAVYPLFRQGFSVFTFDHRGHGSSGGVGTTFGLVEAGDIEAAYRQLQARMGGCHGPILLYGISMGGAAAQVAAPRLPGLGALVLDSTFASFDHVAPRLLPISGVAARLAVGLGRLWSFPITGRDLLGFEPIREAPRLPTMPVLLLHAEADPMVPIEEAELLKQAYGDRARLERLPGAHHANGFVHAPAQHAQALSELLARLPR
jgi:alpha-beta hydrolase superfamily lysophospholipase